MTQRKPRLILVSFCFCRRKVAFWSSGSHRTRTTWTRWRAPTSSSRNSWNQTASPEVSQASANSAANWSTVWAAHSGLHNAKLMQPIRWGGTGEGIGEIPHQRSDLLRIVLVLAMFGWKESRVVNQKKKIRNKWRTTFLWEYVCCHHAVSPAKFDLRPRGMKPGWRWRRNKRKCTGSALFKRFGFGLQITWDSSRKWWSSYRRPGATRRSRKSTSIWCSSTNQRPPRPVQVNQSQRVRHTDKWQTKQQSEILFHDLWGQNMSVRGLFLLTRNEIVAITTGSVVRGRGPHLHCRPHSPPTYIAFHVSWRRVRFSAPSICHFRPAQMDLTNSQRRDNRHFQALDLRNYISLFFSLHPPLQGPKLCLVSFSATRAHCECGVCWFCVVFQLKHLGVSEPVQYSSGSVTIELLKTWSRLECE